ncbi:hypothetical protein EK904_012459, partial [Melospiza melodia maxima]
LTYQSFEVEESEDWSYDAMTVYEDVGKEEKIVVYRKLDESLFIVGLRLKLLKKRSIKQNFIHSNSDTAALLQLAELLEFTPCVNWNSPPSREEVLEPSRMCVVTGWGHLKQ